jgi:hypothetical protein
MGTVFGFASLVFTALWFFTFIASTRRAMARTVFAPCHFPLRRARWLLACLAVTSFVMIGATASTSADHGVVPRGQWVIIWEEIGETDLGKKRVFLEKDDLPQQYQTLEQCNKGLQNLPDEMDAEEFGNHPLDDDGERHLRVQGEGEVVSELESSGECVVSNGGEKFSWDGSASSYVETLMKAAGGD